MTFELKVAKLLHCIPPLLSQSEVRVPDFPANEAKGSHAVPFTQTIFIEQSDFREVREDEAKINTLAVYIAVYLGAIFGLWTDDNKGHLSFSR